ncbi:hypothetical protein [Pseudomonas sp. D3-10]|uniref:hypothetical protein n=1 Tax=Pseudomonas sp. D3-10 TaxID=2817392 RepID=UPI003DA8FC93
MNRYGHDFTEGQRRALDRYISFLGGLRSVFDRISAVLERSRVSGHQAASLPRDSRLDNAYFNGRALSALGGDVSDTKALVDTHVAELRLFAGEALGLAEKTPRQTPLSEIDYRRFSLSRSERWKLSSPKNVGDLVHELYLRLVDVRSAIRQLDFKFAGINQDSFGVYSIFTRAMDHRSCYCHDRPTLAQALFQQASTSPSWDLGYSSTDASIRATEYKADIAALFNIFSNLNSQMGLLARALYLSMDAAMLEVERASYAGNLKELNFGLGAAIETLEQCTTMLDDFHRWLCR